MSLCIHSSRPTIHSARPPIWWMWNSNITVYPQLNSSNCAALLYTLIYSSPSRSTPLLQMNMNMRLITGGCMLRWAVHLPSEMCHINHNQSTNDHLAEAPAEGNFCPLGTIICVDLQAQAHLASSTALMAVLLCHPPICSPQLKIMSPLRRRCWKVWQLSVWNRPQTGSSRQSGDVQKQYTKEGLSQSRSERRVSKRFTGSVVRKLFVTYHSSWFNWKSASFQLRYWR